MIKFIDTVSQIVVAPLPDTPTGPDELARIMSVVFVISGSLALLVIVIGGFRYVISRGEPSATAQAKNTILYGIIGLIVVIVAASVVAFVVNIV